MRVAPVTPQRSTLRHAADRYATGFPAGSPRVPRRHRRGLRLLGHHVSSRRATAAAAKVNGERIPLEVGAQGLAGPPGRARSSALRDELPPSSSSREQQRLLDDFIRRELLLQRRTSSAIASATASLPKTLYADPGTAGRRQVLARSLRGAAAAAGPHRRRSSSASSATSSRSAQLRNGIAVSAFVTPGEIAASRGARGRRRATSSTPSSPRPTFGAGTS